MSPNELLLSENSLKGILPPRKPDSHKGDYGHLLIIAGCQTMPGAAVLATGSALHSGCSLVTLHSSSRALQAVANNYPSAMLSEDPGEVFSELPPLDKYTAIAVGPGLGQSPRTSDALGKLLEALSQKGSILTGTGSAKRPALILDADALNLLSRHPEWTLPKGTVLTPHIGELRRLLPRTSRTDIQEYCREQNCILVAKGHRSEIFTPDGRIYTNSCGNAGLAKGGSGDVLTGLVGGLLARGLSPEDAAGLGVWIHARAADELSQAHTMEAWDSKDLIDWIWTGFQALLR